MEEETLEKIKKYESVKNSMQIYKERLIKAETSINNAISYLNQSKDSVCINGYISTLNNIKQNITSNKNKIIYTIIPSIDIKIKELKMNM